MHVLSVLTLFSFNCSRSQNCWDVFVSSPPLNVGTRFADWIAINNIGRERGSTGRENKGFALSVPTIFVWDCVREEFEALWQITRLVRTYVTEFIVSCDVRCGVICERFYLQWTDVMNCSSYYFGNLHVIKRDLQDWVSGPAIFLERYIDKKAKWFLRAQLIAWQEHVRTISVTSIVFSYGKSLECVRFLEKACGESKKKAFSVTKTVRNTYEEDDLWNWVQETGGSWCGCLPVSG